MSRRRRRLLLLTVISSEFIHYYGVLERSSYQNVSAPLLSIAVPFHRTNVYVLYALYISGNEMHFVKLPNFLSVEQRPFDPENYEDELDEDSSQQQVLSVVS